MNIGDVTAELAEKLGQIDQLRVYDYEPASIAPPCAWLSLPNRIDFDQTFGRGSDEIEIGAMVVVGKASAPVATNAIAQYANGSGPRSVKAALDSSNTNTYTSCDTVRVASADFLYIDVAGTGYLGVEFTVEISGSGS